MLDIRKIVYQAEEVHAEGGRPLSALVHRAAAIAVIRNPLADQFIEDLSSLFDVGEALGQQLMPKLTSLLPGAVVSYGKAAMVGVNGDPEHGAAILHPKLGKPFRAAVGGGDAIICANVKVAAAGATLDVPLANKDNIWSFDELDTITVSVADAPRPDEIMVVLAVAGEGRPHARIGKGRAAT